MPGWLKVSHTIFEPYATKRRVFPFPYRSPLKPRTHNSKDSAPMLFVPFIIFTIILRFINLLTPKARKEKIRTSIENIWLKHSDTDPIVLARFPCSLTLRIFDKFLCPSWSKAKRITAIAVYTWLLLFSSLALSGLASGSFLGFENPPQATMKADAANFIETMSKVEAERTEPSTHSSQLNSTFFYKWFSGEFIWLQITLFYLTFIIGPIICVTECFKKSRIVLDKIRNARDQHDIKSYTCYHSLSLSLYFLIFTAISSLLFFQNTQLLATIGISTLGPDIPSVVGSLISVPIISILSVSFAGLWFKSLIGIALIPSIIVFASVTTSILLNSFKEPLLKALLWVALKSVEHDSGPLQFTIDLLVILGLIGTLTAALTW